MQTDDSEKDGTIERLNSLSTDEVSLEYYMIINRKQVLIIVPSFSLLLHPLLPHLKRIKLHLFSIVKHHPNQQLLILPYHPYQSLYSIVF